MIRKSFFALMAVLMAVASAQAGVVVTSDAGVPTNGLAGYKTYSLTATSDVEGEFISVANFIGNPDDNDPNSPGALGFFGAMNQLEAGGPGTTVFNNFNFALPNSGAADSQFKESSNNVIVVASKESPNFLRAAYSYATPSAMTLPLAQLVIPDAATGAINYRGQFSVARGGTIVDLDALTGCIGVCGSVPVLPTVGNLSLVANALNEVVSDTVALTDVATLAFDNINTPAFVPLIPLKPLELGQLPTLDNAGNFSWNTAGSKRGLYTWSITGTNPDGSDGGMISVEVTQIPEPATLSLFGLALVGFIGCARKRS